MPELPASLKILTRSGTILQDIAVTRLLENIALIPVVSCNDAAHEYPAITFFSPAHDAANFFTALAVTAIFQLRNFTTRHRRRRP